MSDRFTVDARDRLGAALTRARDTVRRGDAAAADAAYTAVLRRADEQLADRALWSALAAEHVGALRARGALARASAACDRYMTAAHLGKFRYRKGLLVERAQLRSQRGEHAAAAADVLAIRSGVAESGDGLDAADDARLLRVEALAAADAGDLPAAALLLDRAAAGFEALNDTAAAAFVDGDRRLLAARRGSDDAVAEILAGPRPETLPGRLAYALALKRRLRYEEALAVVAEALAAADFAEAPVLPVLDELVALLALLRRGRALTAVAPEVLAAAAARGAGPEEGSGPASATRFASAMLDVFLLLEQGMPEAAAARLATIHPDPGSERDLAFWHLAAGEAALARFRDVRAVPLAVEAIDRLEAAARHASAEWLLEIRVRALRLRGHAYGLIGKSEAAARHWAQAHELEEVLVSRQVSDDARVRMLHDVSDEYDERVRMAAETPARADPSAAPEAAAAAVAGIVVAMEAARGAAILGRVAPGLAPALRALPGPGDHGEAWAWLRGVADRLAPDEAIWILHATPDRVHHAVVGRRLARHGVFAVRRADLADDIETLRGCYDERLLVLPEVRAAFSGIVEGISQAIGAGAMVGGLPAGIRRLVVVAGGILSDIPMAALPIRDPATGPGDQGSEPLGSRFAVSDLPCISVRTLLRTRASANRGDQALVVDALSDHGVPSDRRGVLLVGDEATPRNLGRELSRVRFRRVRITSHGQSDSDDPSLSWLRLRPEPSGASGASGASGGDGRLRPQDLQDMDLSSCGTLVLGACESGMAQRVGRDERTGFVRAGLHAGAASVVAARWVAAAPAAEAVLARFERYLRFLPRDLALRQAQLDVRDGVAGLSAPVPDIGHPVWWACWTLYGDAGHQTRAGALRRVVLRRLLLRRLGRPARRGSSGFAASGETPA